MSIKQTPTGLLLVIAGVLAFTTQNAAAYIDPGSGSYLFQILIAGFTAIVFFFSTIKRKFAQFFQTGLGTKARVKKPEQAEELASETIEVASPREP